MLTLALSSQASFLLADRVLVDEVVFELVTYYFTQAKVAQTVLGDVLLEAVRHQHGVRGIVSSV